MGSGSVPVEYQSALPVVTRELALGPAMPCNEDGFPTLLNHVNTYTCLAYKNDPTIMAWETGNELDPPTSWTQTISI